MIGQVRPGFFLAQDKDPMKYVARMQALTPLTIGRSRVAASALGALWGFGHSTGQLILGLIMVLLKVG
jgi:hypothetical protein